MLTRPFSSSYSSQNSLHSFSHPLCKLPLFSIQFHLHLLHIRHNPFEPFLVNSCGMAAETWERVTHRYWSLAALTTQLRRHLNTQVAFTCTSTISVRTPTRRLKHLTPWVRRFATHSSTHHIHTQRKQSNTGSLKLPPIVGQENLHFKLYSCFLTHETCYNLTGITNNKSDFKKRTP